jgi:hypothetical protein
LSFKSSYAFSLNHNLFLGGGGGGQSLLSLGLLAFLQARKELSSQTAKNFMLDLFCDPVLVWFVTPYISLLCKKKKKKKKKKKLY